MNLDYDHIEVLQPGIAVTIQDMGRYGYFSEGIPISGVMDREMAGLANALVNNNENDAVIEWKLIPPRLRFQGSNLICVCALNTKCLLNGKEFPVFSSIPVCVNDVLEIKLIAKSSYGYLAINGGVLVEKIMGSRSFFKRVSHYNMLQKGMFLPIYHKEGVKKSYSKIKPWKPSEEIVVIEVSKGIEFNLLTIKEQRQITNKTFTVNEQSNRMGFLLNEKIEVHSFSILSSPVLPGTVQWTPSGELIVLMRNAQTIGGYPRIFQLHESSISKLARVVFGQFIQFKLV